MINKPSPLQRNAMQPPPATAANAASSPEPVSIKPPKTRCLIEHDHTTGNATISLLGEDNTPVGGATLDCEQHGEWLNYLVGIVVQVALSLLRKR